MTPSISRPVRPVDGASVVLVRGRGAKAEVLMGRRRPRAAFLPNIYVFPGGRVDPADYDVPSGIELRPDVAQRLTRRCGASPAPALAMAAIRETHEETGFLLGDPVARHDAPRDAPRDATSPIWRAFAQAGAAPAFARLEYVARAITPTLMPRRFNTRFFMVDARHAMGELRQGGELLDLRWVSLDGGWKKLNVVDVTEFVLGAVRDRLALSSGQRAALPVPLLCYVNRVGRVILE